MTGELLQQWIFVGLVQGLAVYFFVSNLVHLFLLGASFLAIRRTIFSRPMLESVWRRTVDLGPAVSIIAPAFNEEKSIVASVNSFLQLEYPRLEVLVVNDGSTDSSLEKLKAEFRLMPAKIFYDNRLSAPQPKGVFRSQMYPQLIVIDKANSGKAESINVAIGYASYEIFCAVDADCILERDAILKVILPFIENPETTIAAGGTVRPMNGSWLRNRRMSPHLPWNPLVLFQIVEYLRAFLFGRVGWNYLDATMIVSGAFGIFKKEAIIQAGGYLSRSVGEDMELIVRLRELSEDGETPGKIAFIPDPICWTEVPGDLLSLGRQRDRWQRGLAESLFAHRRLFFNPRYGVIGLFAYPVFFFFELLQPLMELMGHLLIIVGWASGLIPQDLIILLIITHLLFGTMMSFGAVLIEESAFHKYPKISQLGVLLLFALFEHIVYRPYINLWRLWGMLRFLMGKKEWGEIKRQDFQISGPT